MASLSFPGIVRGQGPSAVDIYLQKREMRNRERNTALRGEELQYNRERVAAADKAQAAETAKAEEEAKAKQWAQGMVPFLGAMKSSTGMERRKVSEAAKAHTQQFFPDLDFTGGDDVDDEEILGLEAQIAGILGPEAIEQPEPEMFQHDPSKNLYKDGKLVAEAAPGGGKEDQRARKIKEYQDLYGMSPENATAIADGLVKMEINDKTGKVLLTDVRDGTVKELDIDPSAEASPLDAVQPEASGVSMYDLADLATGAGSMARAIWNHIPLISDLAPAKKTEMARSLIKQSTGALIRALSVNPRYPVTEQERIRKAIDLEPSFFDTPQAMRSRMVSAHIYLTHELLENQRVQNDPNAGEDMRRDAEKTADAIGVYLKKLAVLPSDVAEAIEDLQNKPGGLSAEKQARLDELRKKRDEGTLDASQ